MQAASTVWRVSHTLNGLTNFTSSASTLMIALASPRHSAAKYRPAKCLSVMHWIIRPRHGYIHSSARMRLVGRTSTVFPATNPVQVIEALAHGGELRRRGLKRHGFGPILCESIDVMPKQYPKQQRDRAVRLVLAHLDEYDSAYLACKAVGPKVGVGMGSLHRWAASGQPISAELPRTEDPRPARPGGVSRPISVRRRGCMGRDRRP